MNEQNKREKKELCTKEKEIKAKRGNASGQDKKEGGARDSESAAELTHPQATFGLF